MNIRQQLVSPNKYNIKCPYEMEAEGYAIHNTSNDASAKNEVNYMLSNNSSVSYHYAIDDIEVVQAIPENRNAFHAGDGIEGKGNRKYIGIEICYSKSGGERFTKAEKNAATFIAVKLKSRGWDISHVKKHQDFSGKYCPHRTLDMGWQRFLNMIQNELNKLNEEEQDMTRDEVQAMIDASKERVYHYWDEVPDWAYNPLMALYKKKYFFGKSASDLDLPYSTMRTLTVLARALKADGKLNY